MGESVCVYKDKFLNFASLCRTKEFLVAQPQTLLIEV